PTARLLERSDLGLQRGHEFHLAHAERLQQHALLLRRQGDAWIASWVPALLAAMAGKKAALLITFDEGYTTPPYVYTAFIGTAANLAYKSSAAYSHYSFSKLLEDVWGGGNLGQNDVTAPS